MRECARLPVPRRAVRAAAVSIVPEPFRIPAFRAFWLARLTSTIAQMAMIIVIGWQVYDLARETMDLKAAALRLGIIGLVQFAPLFILTLLTGWTADRIDRRYIAMGAAGWHICLDVLGLLLDGHGQLVGDEHFPPQAKERADRDPLFEFSQLRPDPGADRDHHRFRLRSVFGQGPGMILSAYPSYRWPEAPNPRAPHLHLRDRLGGVGPRALGVADRLGDRFGLAGERGRRKPRRHRRRSQSWRP